MKKILLFTMIAGLLFSCKEEFIGQYPTDSIPPKPVSNVREVSKISGGVILTYDIPDDRDLLYVQADYTLDTGEKMIVKSSMYGTELKVSGFAKPEARTIFLRTVDRSQNFSDPVEVTITPYQSAIYDVEESLEIIPDFGGMQLKWDNPNKGDVVVMVSKEITEGSDVLETVGNFYSTAPDGIAYIRGFKAVPQTFMIQIKDRWGNITEKHGKIITPLYEEFIAPKDANQQYFKRWNNDPSIPYKQYSDSYKIEKLWDGITMYGTTTSNMYHTPAGEPFPIRFTLDMGRVFKLSRFKLYQRGDKWAYEHGNPKEFRIYGSADDKARLVPVNPDEHEWTLLGEFSSIKPSGSPLGQRTSEDIEKGSGGEDYNFSYGSIYSVRYMMIQIDKTWGGTEMIHVSELEFWGQNPDNEEPEAPIE